MSGAIRTFADWVFANQMAWYRHKWDDTGRVRSGTRLAGTIGVLAAPALVVAVLGAAISFVVGETAGMAIMAVATIVICFPLWRRVEHYFDDNYEAISDNANDILRNPSEGPRKALRRLLGMIGLLFGFAFLAAVILRMALVAAGVVS